MDITINSEVLKNELMLAQAAAEKKPSIPILSTVLFSAKDGVCRISATDWNVGTVADVPVEMRQAGTLCLPVRRLADIVATFTTPTDLDIENDRTAGIIRWPDGRLRFTCPPAVEDFPSLPDMPEPFMEIDALRAVVTKVMTSISTTKYILRGALFDVSTTALKAVSTDGHRLTLTVVPVTSSVDVKVLIPKEMLSLILTSSPASGTVHFAKDEKHVFVSMGHRVIIGRTMVGEFPNYEAIIPPANGNVGKANRAALLEAVTRAGTQADGRHATIALILSKKSSIITAKSGYMDDYSAALPIEYSGEEIAVGLNWNYLSDFLRVTECEEVTLSLKGSQDPVMIESADAKYVLMPMRI